MNYELAKELKDAGFPYDWTPDEFFYEGSPRPTLEELIEACGNRFRSLELIGGNPEPWTASMTFTYNAQQGTTPEEAVARLWLALNKK